MDGSQFLEKLNRFPEGKWYWLDLLARLRQALKSRLGFRNDVFAMDQALSWRNVDSSEREQIPVLLAVG